MHLRTHPRGIVAEYNANQDEGLFLWYCDEINNLTCRIRLAAVETKHSTTLYKATGLNQECQQAPMHGGQER